MTIKGYLAIAVVVTTIGLLTYIAYGLSQFLAQ